MNDDDPLEVRLSQGVLAGEGFPSQYELLPESYRWDWVYLRDEQACRVCETYVLPEWRMTAAEIREARAEGIPLGVIHHLAYNEPARMSAVVLLCREHHDAWHAVEKWPPRICQAERDRVVCWAQERSRVLGQQ